MTLQQPLTSTARRMPTAGTLLRLIKPGVGALLVFTAVMTTLAADNPWLSWSHLAALVAAGSLTASGAAALNHVIDRKLDALMPRTAGRPIPAGQISARGALVWGLLLCAAGLTLGVLSLPREATLLILAGLLIYVPLYSYALKRNTRWAVVIGGLAGCCPVLAGWAIARGDWPMLPLALAAVVFFWTPAHFWAYAIAHLESYRLTGLPILPCLIGIRATLPFILAHTLAAVIIAPLVLTGPAALIAGLSGALLIGFCLSFCRTPDRRRALRFYHVSNYYLALVFLSLLAL